MRHAVWARLLVLVLALWLGQPVAAGELQGVVAWGQRVELGMLVSGVIETVHVEVGQQVSKNAPLVSLDRRGFASQVDRRNAEYQHAQALLEEAERDDMRAAELYDRTVLSDYERNQAAIALKAARAAVGRARAELVDARLALERSVIKAPFDGVVLSVDAAPGQSIVSELQSRPLVVLGDAARLRVRAQVDAEQAGTLEPGMTLQAVVRGQSLVARVAHIGLEPLPGATDGRQNYALLADLEAAPGQVRVGESITLSWE
jgi:multidrug efflux system membrane fusion protein